MEVLSFIVGGNIDHIIRAKQYIVSIPSFPVLGLIHNLSDHILTED